MHRIHGDDTESASTEIGKTVEEASNVLNTTNTNATTTQTNKQSATTLKHKLLQTQIQVKIQTQ